VPDGLKAHLLAATREALSNVGRHAVASEVEVRVRLDDPLVLTVTDNGVGVEPGATPGNGLRNLATRAQELGGELTLSPAVPSGTVLRWEVPWPPTAGDDPASAASL
jgi:signal transduction histidine kinase